MAKIKIDKNILGYWELFTYDINMYNFRKKEDKKIPYVSYLNIGFKINEKNSSEKLENTIRQKDERLTNRRTKQ